MTNTFLSYNVVVLLHKSHNYELYHLAIPDLSRTFTCSAKLCNLGFSPITSWKQSRSSIPPPPPSPNPQPRPPNPCHHPTYSTKALHESLNISLHHTPPLSLHLSPPFPGLAFVTLGLKFFDIVSNHLEFLH